MSEYLWFSIIHFGLSRAWVIPTGLLEGKTFHCSSEKLLQSEQSCWRLSHQRWMRVVEVDVRLLTKVSDVSFLVWSGSCWGGMKGQHRWCLKPPTFSLLGHVCLKCAPLWMPVLYPSTECVSWFWLLFLLSKVCLVSLMKNVSCTGKHALCDLVSSPLGDVVSGSGCWWVWDEPICCVVQRSLLVCLMFPAM